LRVKKAFSVGHHQSKGIPTLYIVERIVVNGYISDTTTLDMSTACKRSLNEPRTSWAISKAFVNVTTAFYHNIHKFFNVGRYLDFCWKFISYVRMICTGGVLALLRPENEINYSRVLNILCLLNGALTFVLTSLSY
jgi:hypothetical protein